MKGSNMSSFLNYDVDSGDKYTAQVETCGPYLAVSVGSPDGAHFLTVKDAKEVIAALKAGIKAIPPRPAPAKLLRDKDGSYWVRTCIGKYKCTWDDKTLDDNEYNSLGGVTLTQVEEMYDAKPVKARKRDARVLLDKQGDKWYNYGNGRFCATVDCDTCNDDNMSAHRYKHVKETYGPLTVHTA